MIVNASQDAGYAWVICFACFMVHVLRGCVFYGGGMIYIMLQDSLNASKASLALVISLHTGFVYGLCPLVGLLTIKYGERKIGFVGAAIGTIGLVCSSQATEVYHLYIAYSVCNGIGMAFTYNTALSMLSVYFVKRLKSATGIATCGTGLGSLLFPPLIQLLEENYGWRGFLLLLAGINAQVFVICALYFPLDQQTVTNHLAGKGLHQHVECELAVENRSPHDDRIDPSEANGTLTQASPDNVAEVEGQEEKEDRGEHTKAKSIPSDEMIQSKNNHQIDAVSVRDASEENHTLPINLRQEPGLCSLPCAYARYIFSSIPFCCFCLHGFMIILCNTAIIAHLGAYILSLGFSSAQVMSSYMTFGITVIFARALIGIATEATGANIAGVIGVSTFLHGIVTLLFPLIRSQPIFYIYAFLCGILLAPTMVFWLPMTVDGMPASLVATAFGISCAVTMPATIISPPLSAWLYEKTSMYACVFYLAGTESILASLLMLPLFLISYRRNKMKGADTLPQAQKNP